MFRYEFTSKSKKQFLKLDLQVQFRIIKYLDKYCTEPNPLVHADPITDPELGQYRFRIGDYRVIFDIKEDLITILRVGDRKNIYR
jgi:mRNA interferase RelE/StbE